MTQRWGHQPICEQGTSEALVTSPSLDLMLKLGKTERRFHEFVVAEFQVILDELLDSVIDGHTLEGVHVNTEH